ncbi:MAG: sulfur carrier protein ThiS [bacterium]|nr:sulfur carrier protein ThiS [bacterium]
MKITVNNNETRLDRYEQINVKQLLAHMKYTFPMIVVKVNGKLVKKPQYETFQIVDGDVVQAIHLIGGG